MAASNDPNRFRGGQWHRGAEGREHTAAVRAVAWRCTGSPWWRREPAGYWPVTVTEAKALTMRWSEQALSRLAPQMCPIGWESSR
ncbi:hypothetical protein GCM10022224_060390 [Nonomuraea antimicrobica]|uniref:Uncharacterized protein n=1 Tax=Nonomuraea antimicrobica TaxID=561173 RepID=A0ABP7CCG3_9ACTN